MKKLLQQMVTCYSIKFWYTYFHSQKQSRESFFEKGVPNFFFKNVLKKQENNCVTLFFNIAVGQKETDTGVFCKIFKNTFFYWTPPGDWLCIHFTVSSHPWLLIETRFFKFPTREVLQFVFHCKCYIWLFSMLLNSKSFPSFFLAFERYKY